jgi:hypothetical protein
MYYPNDIEDICYQQDHIDKVWNEIEKVLPIYFEKYINTEGGHSVTADEIEKLAAKFGSTSKPKNKSKDIGKILKFLLNDAINSYEKERPIYQEILDLDSLKEYKYDVNSFKNTVLKNEIPLIRRTLQNKQAKELDKFRAAFNSAQPGHLFEVTSNIVQLAYELHRDWYEEEEFELTENCDDLEHHAFDAEGYTAFGVIGGGIKSHFLYKIFPDVYPNRSREAIWALYYLSNKKKFGCKEDSQFLMINAKEGTTQQNYFYPYGLFSFYALRIFSKIKEFYKRNTLVLPTEYRFVIVDNFLSFVAKTHQAEIDLLKQKSNGYQYDY